MRPVHWDHTDHSGLRVMSSKIGKSFTVLPSSSLTGAVAAADRGGRGRDCEAIAKCVKAA
jgi:hypothetical protein